MEGDENENGLSVDFQVRSIEYNICTYLNNNEDQLIVEVRDNATANLWRGVYDSNHIEELTRKTGNFKSFHIFINMLHTAMKKESNTVSLDIMTFSDLESMRNKKLNNNSSTSSSKTQSSFDSDNKRFFILTYVVEFDRINYPLQLSYQGKADVDFLLHTIEKLKNKIKSLESRNKSSPSENTGSKTIEIIKLEKENEILKQEKEALKLLLTQREQEQQQNGNEENDFSNLRNNNNISYQKDIRLLKQIIKTLEEKSLKEKNMFQTQLIKKRKEIDILREQLSEKKIIETNLKNEIRILRNEIKMHNSRRSSTSLQRRSSSQDSSKRTSVLISRDRSNGSHNSRPQSAYFTNPNPVNNIRRRVDRSASPSPSLISQRKSSASPCPSIGSNRSNSVGKKFNPTDYINKKKSKLQEIEMKKKTEIRKRLNSGGSNSNLHRSGSNLSIASNNSLDTNSVYSLLSNSSQRKNQQVNNSINKPTLSNKNAYLNNRQATLSSDFDDNQQDNYISYNAPFSVTQKNSKTNKYLDLYNREKEMKEIDLKLKSLQLLIKNNIS